MTKGTAAKVLALISTLARDPREWSLKELAVDCEIDKSTAYRLLGTMKALGYVDKNLKTKSYSVGPKLRSLFSPRYDHLAYTAHPTLEWLSKSLNATATIRIREGNQMVVIDRIEGQGHLRVTYPIGDRHPISFGGSGKVFLAFLSKEEVAGLIVSTGSGNEKQVSRLHRELQQIRKKSYAVTSGVVTKGIVTVSLPVLGKSQTVLGVLSLSWPTAQYRLDDIKNIIEFGAKGASEIANNWAQGFGKQLANEA